MNGDGEGFNGFIATKNYLPFPCLCLFIASNFLIEEFRFELKLAEK